MSQPVIKTGKVKGRVSLRFDTLDEMVAHAGRLVAEGTKQLGNWTLGQNLQHLALTQIASMDGFQKVWPMPLRFLVRLMFKNWLLRRGFPASGPSPKALLPETIESEVALFNFRAATERVKTETKRSLHPLFGTLSLEDWTRLYLRHAELHLSFCVPLSQVPEST